MNNSSTKPHNRLEKSLVASTLRCMVSRSSRLRPRLYEAIQATKGLTKGYHNPQRKLTETVESGVLWTWFRPKRWCDYFAGRVLQVCPVFVKVHQEILTAHSLINHYMNRKRSVYFWVNRKWDYISRSSQPIVFNFSSYRLLGIADWPLLAGQPGSVT